VAGKVQGRLVVVGGEDARAAVEGYEGREPDTDAELGSPSAPQVLFREPPGECPGARPDVGPVREAFVPVELPFVDQVVGDGRVG
jgi:hypothetical protein